MVRGIGGSSAGLLLAVQAMSLMDHRPREGVLVIDDELRPSDVPFMGDDILIEIGGASAPAPVETVFPRARPAPRPWPASDPRAVEAVAKADKKRARKNARRAAAT